MKILALFIVVCLFAGCVRRPPPQPMAIRQANDANLTCEQLAIEYRTNTEVAAKKIATNNSADTTDFWLGFLVWPGLADFQNADGHEGNAMLDRNIYLREIAKAKNCSGMESWPPQPERYTFRTISRHDRA